MIPIVSIVREKSPNIDEIKIKIYINGYLLEIALLFYSFIVEILRAKAISKIYEIESWNVLKVKNGKRNFLVHILVLNFLIIY